jgi:hypothetical protein
VPTTSAQHAPRFAAGNLERNNDRYAPVRALAHELGLEPGQLALAWLLAQDPRRSPDPRQPDTAHIVENVEAARVLLHDQTLARLDQALAAFQPEGSTLCELRLLTRATSALPATQAPALHPARSHDPPTEPLRTEEHP